MCWLSYSEPCTLLTEQFLSQTKENNSCSSKELKQAASWSLQKTCPTLICSEFSLILIQWKKSRIEHFFQLLHNFCTLIALHVCLEEVGTQGRTHNQSLAKNIVKIVRNQPALEQGELCMAQATHRCPGSRKHIRARLSHSRKAELAAETPVQQHGEVFLRASAASNKGPPGELLPGKSIPGFAHLQFHTLLACLCLMAWQ